MSRILRILFAFVIACTVAGLVQVLFVKTPAELLAISQIDRMAFLETTGLLTLVAATQSANFAAPFALIAIICSYVLETRTTLFYTLTGLAIAVLALIALHQMETDNIGTLLNLHAIIAFTLSGLVGGYVYARVAGTKKRPLNSHRKLHRDVPHQHNIKNSIDSTDRPGAKPVMTPPSIPGQNGAERTRGHKLNPINQTDRATPATVRVIKSETTGSVPVTVQKRKT